PGRGSTPRPPRPARDNRCRRSALECSWIAPCTLPVRAGGAISDFHLLELGQHAVDPRTYFLAIALEPQPLLLFGAQRFELSHDLVVLETHGLALGHQVFLLEPDEIGLLLQGLVLALQRALLL